MREVLANLGFWGRRFGTVARLGAVVLLLLGLLSPPASAGQAGNCSANQTLHWRGGSLRLENDLFAGTDRNYTNGASIVLVSRDLEGPLAPDCLPFAVGMFAAFIARANPDFWQAGGTEGPVQNVVLRFGQSMYTPTDKARTDLIVEERPYAGLLSMSLAWNRRWRAPGRRVEILDTRELTLGVIGPWSLAEQTQNLVHDLRGIERFHGWDNQLHNEPAFQLAWERKIRPLASGAVRPGFGNDVIGSGALRIGNIETSASLGVEARAGWNLPNDFGSYPIRPGAENRPPSALAQGRGGVTQGAGAPRPGVHAFVSLEAKAVAWDFSLDGNLLRDSHRVQRRPFVAQAAAGISSQWQVAGHGLRLAVMRVWRTQEFRGQSGSHAFGSVAASLEF